MKEIPLTKGYVATVDDNDFARVKKYRWRVSIVRHPDGSIKNTYAIRNAIVSGKRTTQYMHRFILGITDPKIEVDHAPDHSGLNNQRSNLRLAICVQNQHNQRLSVVNTSGLKGVCWHKATQKWQAQIKVQDKRIHLGLFTSKEEAAAAYDAAALLYHKEFALTNAMLAKEAA